MRSILRLTVLLGAIGIFTLSAVTPALASPPSVTLSGSVTDFLGSPASDTFDAHYEATLSGGVAGGILNTNRRHGDELNGVRYNFKGSVTCMIDRGSKFVLGALGTVTAEPSNGPPHELTGTYAQLFTIEYGEWANDEEEFGSPFPSRYGGMLGPNGEGVPSTTGPDCTSAKFRQPSYFYPTRNSGGHVSPSIQSPHDGHVSHSGTVLFKGKAEPSSSILFYEVGQEETGTEVAVDAKGKWSTTLSGLSSGSHVFAAKAIEGSTTASNTVEVIVH
jgi:hypothetical protein